MDFREEVRNNFKPKCDEKSRFKLAEEKKILSPSPKDRLERGNEYLNEARKKGRKQSPEEKERKISEEIIWNKPIGTISEKYPNYITDIKEQNKKRETENLGNLLK